MPSGTNRLGDKDGKAPPARVLIIVENLPVPLDRRVWQEAMTLQRAGYEVSVICPTGPGAERRHEVIGGVHVYRYPPLLEAGGAAGYFVEYPVALLWQAVLAFRVWLSRGFDVLHACNPPDNIFIIAAFFKYILGKKFVFDHHDLCPELYEAKFLRRDLLYHIMIMLEKLTFLTADITISSNDSFRRIALTRGKRQEQDVYVVRSCPDVSGLLPVNAKPPDTGRRTVGFVGIMAGQDGVALLIDAAHHVVNGLNRRDTEFLLVGGGPALEEAKAQVERYGLAEHVTFTGYLTGDALREAMSRIDVGVSPDPCNALNDKLTMNKVLEYMAFGIPVVMFNLQESAAMADGACVVATDNDPVKLAESIVDLLDDPIKRAAMGEVGRRRIATELSWQNEATKLIAAYESLNFATRRIKRRRPGPRSGFWPSQASE